MRTFQQFREAWQSNPAGEIANQIAIAYSDGGLDKAQEVISVQAHYIRMVGKGLFDKIVMDLDNRFKGQEAAGDLEDLLKAEIGDFPGPRRPQEPTDDYDNKLHGAIVDRDWFGTR